MKCFIKNCIVEIKEDGSKAIFHDKHGNEVEVYCDDLSDRPPQERIEALRNRCEDLINKRLL